MYRGIELAGLGGTCSSQGHVDTTSWVGSGVSCGIDWARMAEGGVGTAGGTGSAGTPAWEAGAWEACAEW